MPDFAAFSLFFSAAIVLAVTLGSGIFYVMIRSVKGAHVEGSTLGRYVALAGEGE